MTLASLRAHVRGLAISAAAERKTVARMARELAHRKGGPGDPYRRLSGGNQQKVVIARALLACPRVLAAGRADAGIDVGAKVELRAFVRRLADEGVGIVFVSSDIEEILEVADRIVVLSNGRVTGRFPAGEVSEAELVAAAVFGTGARPERTPHEPARAPARPGGARRAGRGLLVPLAAFLTQGNLVMLAKHVALNAILALA